MPDNAELRKLLDEALDLIDAILLEVDRWEHLPERSDQYMALVKRRDANE